MSAGAYYVPNGSHWPIVGSIGMFTMLAGAANFMNGSDSSVYFLYIGLGILIFMMFGWFGTVITESENGVYNAQVDRSFRMGMTWFIFSEVMFFAAFFGALYYARALVIPWLGGEGAGASTNEFLFPWYEPIWPTNGPMDIGGKFDSMPAFDVPLLNTCLLLASGFTITMAHWNLLANNRGKLIAWMFATVLLGSVFLYFQVEEYIHAYTELNLTMGSGIFGSTFFMLTGFHGMHVTLGTIMLIVITVRCIKGHFTPEQHFGFEAVAWYWHFVDVVWLGLFVFVYVV